MLAVSTKKSENINCCCLRNAKKFMEVKLLFPPQKVYGYFGEPTARRGKELWRNSHIGGTVCNPGTGLLITVWRRYAQYICVLNLFCIKRILHCFGNAFLVLNVSCGKCPIGKSVLGALARGSILLQIIPLNFKLILHQGCNMPWMRIRFPISRYHDFRTCQPFS